jgi:hypothetical protein
MAQLELTPGERVVLQLLVDAAIDGKDSFPLPLNRLTHVQKQYLAQLLLQAAGLCFAKSRRLMDSSPELMLAHMKEFLR